MNNLSKVVRAEFVEGDQILCFISVSKFGELKNRVELTH